MIGEKCPSKSGARLGVGGGERIMVELKVELGLLCFTALSPEPNIGPATSSVLTILIG
jgi:hypothetical protein